LGGKEQRWGKAGRWKKDKGGHQKKGGWGGASKRNISALRTSFFHGRRVKHGGGSGPEKGEKDQGVESAPSALCMVSWSTPGREGQNELEVRKRQKTLLETFKKTPKEFRPKAKRSRANTSKEHGKKGKTPLLQALKNLSCQSAGKRSTVEHAYGPGKEKNTRNGGERVQKKGVPYIQREKLKSQGRG